MPRCYKCNVNKSHTDFHWRSKANNRLQSMCKTCKKDLDQTRYYDPVSNRKKQAHESRALARINAMVAKFSIFLNKSCVDCGENDIRCLVPDHQYDKLENVSKLVSDRKAPELIIEELKKCEIVCANCHAKRTAISHNWAVQEIYTSKMTTDEDVRVMLCKKYGL